MIATATAAIVWLDIYFLAVIFETKIGTELLTIAMYNLTMNDGGNMISAL